MPVAIIALNFRFPPSLRMIEEMLAARGILVSQNTAEPKH